MELSLEFFDNFLKISFPYHSFKENILFLSLTGEEYPIIEGNITLSNKYFVSLEKFEEYTNEYLVPYSSVKQSKTKKGEIYLTGSLTRFNNNFDKFPLSIRELWLKAGFSEFVKNNYCSLLVRLLEINYIIQSSIDIIKNYKKPLKDFEEIKILKNGDKKGFDISESPGGALFHYYLFDEKGIIKRANIILPTSQNQEIMELDIRALIGTKVPKDLDLVKDIAQKLIRNYYPCISCSTHFLKIELKSR